MRATFAFLATALLVSNLVATPLPSKNSTQPTTPYEAIGEGPRFYIDYTNFQGVENLTYTEFYIQISYSDLQFIKYRKRFRSGYDIELSIVDENNKVVESYTNRDVFDVKTFDETKSTQKARLSMVAFTFEPGVYSIKVQVTDHETQKTSDIDQVFTATNFKENTLHLSDIQFSQKIELCNDSRPFVKNSRYIEPCPVRKFANGSADIYVYFEIYNLTYRPEKLNYNYTAYFSIFSKNTEKTTEFQQVHKIPGTTVAHSIKLNVDQFLGGEYDLTVRILDEATGQVVETTKGFTVLSSPIASLNLHDTFQRD